MQVIFVRGPASQRNTKLACNTTKSRIVRLLRYSPFRSMALRVRGVGSFARFRSTMDQQSSPPRSWWRYTRKSNEKSPFNLFIPSCRHMYSYLQSMVVLVEGQSW